MIRTLEGKNLFNSVLEKRFKNNALVQILTIRITMILNTLITKFS